MEAAGCPPAAVQVARSEAGAQQAAGSRARGVVDITGRVAGVAAAPAVGRAHVSRDGPACWTLAYRTWEYVVSLPGSPLTRRRGPTGRRRDEALLKRRQAQQAALGRKHPGNRRGSTHGDARARSHLSWRSDVRLPGRTTPGQVSELSPLPAGGNGAVTEPPVTDTLPAALAVIEPVVKRRPRTSSMMLLQLSDSCFSFHTTACIPL